MSQDLLYALQQVFNGLAVGGTYALMAVGFSLMLGVSNRLNLAFGELVMVGAVVAAIAVLAIEENRTVPVPVLLLAAVGFAMLAASCLGYGTYQLIFARTHPSAPLPALVATIGLAIFISEFVRLTQTAGNIWIRPLIRGGLTLRGDGPFTAHFGTSQLVILATSASVLLVVASALRRSRFGRHARAVAQDPDMAGMLGINARLTAALTFGLAGLVTGLGGSIMAVQYGITNFSMGFVLGLKAFAAAILGGVGSLWGAAAGGLLLGLVETVWSAYFALEYRDIVAFGILIGVIVLRPGGIAGRPPSDVAPSIDVGRR